MKVLIIEDNDGKLQRIKESLGRLEKVSEIDEKKSYNSGIRALMSNQYDLVLLDMSMPTYDKSENEPGGRMRVFGGRDILSQMKRRSIRCPAIVVTQFDVFDTFEESGKKLLLFELERELAKEYQGIFAGLIFYSTGKGDWEAELKKVVLSVRAA